MNKFKKIVLSAIAPLLILLLAGMWFLRRNRELLPLMHINSVGSISPADCGYMHISLDDTIHVFRDITENESSYESIFENDTLKYLQKLHSKYGSVISCYCYYQDGEFDLSMATDKFANEFANNSDWLRFGFHSLNSSKTYDKVHHNELKEDYLCVVRELLRITGTPMCIDNVVRLHCFAGTKKGIMNILNTGNGIIGLLCADTEGRQSYYLDDEDNYMAFWSDVYEMDGIYFINTDLRMENYTNYNIKKELKKYAEDDAYENKRDILVIFTHEWQMKKRRVKKNLETCCQYAVKNEYDFAFVEDRIEDGANGILSKRR